MQKNYSLGFDLSRPGMIQGLGEPRVLPYTNSRRTAQSLVLGPNATNSNVITLTLSNGTRTEQVVYANDGSATAAENLAAAIAAIRNSRMYELATPVFISNATGIRLVGRDPSANLTLTAVGTAANPTVTNTAASGLIEIPFGRFLGRDPAATVREASLPRVDDVLVGISFNTYSAERNAIGATAKTTYRPLEPMDVLDRVNTLEGIWVEAVETSISLGSELYVSVTGGNAGKVTLSDADDAIAIPAHEYSIARGTVVNSDGSRMILLSYNKS